MTAAKAMTLSQALALKTALAKLHFEGWGQLYAQTASTLINPNFSREEQERIRPLLDHAVGGALIVLLFAIFEADGHWPWSLQHDRYFKARDRMRLLAFRHIRHSIAHAPNGGRARTHRTEFEAVMNGDGKIRGVTHWNDDEIHLQSTAGYECLSLMNQVIDDALQRLYDEAR